eukprot:gnl/Spiro4/210_TR117_c0_g1_i1.p1 gnl/Spiro4/210_TR117_c0_g1~~gnl/Spiro4/210_TR117_c0_g1_i1.p1  ORF type:complete len:191 (+),score=46.20 gnl/Spiro4/210_TR117_c0_g1_i1:38-574(+)
MESADDDQTFYGGSLNIQSIALRDCPELVDPTPIEAGHCRPGVFLIIDDSPCKVTALDFSEDRTDVTIVGCDVVTGHQYTKTVPASSTQFEFTPVRVEYEVADITEGQLTAMTPDGREKMFDVPPTEIGAALKADFDANAAAGGDLFFVITVLYAPRRQGATWLANLFLESYIQKDYQ